MTVRVQGLRARRGQGGPISVMILVSATLIVALMLYAYFAGIYSTQQAQMSLVDQISNYANKLTVYVEATLSDESPNGDMLYCDVVSIVNSGGDPLEAYVTILPISRTANSYATNDGILYVPVDYASPYSPIPVKTVATWILADADGDGIVEMVGDNGTAVAVVNEGVASCQDLYQWFINANLSDLPLPPNVDDPNLGFLATSLMLSTTGPSLQELAKAMVPGAPDTMYVPLWNVTIPGNGKVQLYFFTISQIPLQYRSIAITLQYEGAFYLVIAHPINS